MLGMFWTRYDSMNNRNWSSRAALIQLFQTLVQFLECVGRLCPSVGQRTV